MKSALYRAMFVAGFVVIVETAIFGWNAVSHSGGLFLGFFLGTLPIK